MKSLFAALLIAVPAFANAYTWDQTLAFTPAQQITLTSPFSFTHDLTVPDIGFNVGSDSISSYKLTLSLHNDKGMIDYVTIDQPGLYNDTTNLLLNWTVASVTTGTSVEGLWSLNSNGTLDITVKSIFGSFFLDSSELVAVGDKGQTAVPEPASIALLAVGLIGIAVMRRSARAA
jgi:hypothetical protein